MTWRDDRSAREEQRRIDGKREQEIRTAEAAEEAADLAASKRESAALVGAPSSPESLVARVWAAVRSGEPDEFASILGAGLARCDRATQLTSIGADRVDLFGRFPEGFDVVSDLVNPDGSRRVAYLPDPLGEPVVLERVVDQGGSLVVDSYSCPAARPVDAWLAEVNAQRLALLELVDGALSAPDFMALFGACSDLVMFAGSQSWPTAPNAELDGAYQALFDGAYAVGVDCTRLQIWDDRSVLGQALVDLRARIQGGTT
jgi:hypothetical protein